MAKYDPVGTVYKKRKESIWPAVLGGFVLVVILVAIGS